MIKELSWNTLLSMASMYTEIEPVLKQSDPDDEVLRVLNDMHRVYLKKDYATPTGVGMAAHEYIEVLRERDGHIRNFDYEELFSEYHGAGDWY